MWDFFVFLLTFYSIFLKALHIKITIMGKKKKKEILPLDLMFKPKALKVHGVNEMLHELTCYAKSRGDFTITHVKTMRLTKAQARKFYAEHEGKDFYESLVNFISSRDVVAIRIEYDSEKHPDFIKDFRANVIGPTDPNKADPKTMRAKFGFKRDFAEGYPHNAIHCADSPESVAYELPILFPEL